MRSWSKLLVVFVAGGLIAAAPKPTQSTPHNETAPKTSVIHTSLTLTELGSFLGGLGITATPAASAGKPGYLVATAGQLQFIATMGSCQANSQCGGIAFAAIDMKTRPSLEALNEFNSVGGYTHGYRDDQGNGVLTTGHVVYGGVSDANLEAVVATFLNSLVIYAKSRSGTTASVATPSPSSAFASAATARQAIAALIEKPQEPAMPFSEKAPDDVIAKVVASLQ